MYYKIKNNLVSDNIFKRIIVLLILFFILFFGVTVLSYYFLPEGFLLNKNEISNFDTSSNILISTIQIFLYNMISVFFIILGSLFAKKRSEDDNFISYAYICFLIFIVLNAVTLGTWSFTAGTEAVPLLDRIIRTFDIIHRAGLLEMIGQLLICCAVANKYLVMTYKKDTKTRKLKDISFNKYEIISIVLGFALMITGAFVESSSIINNL